MAVYLRQVVSYLCAVLPQRRVSAILGTSFFFIFRLISSSEERLVNFSIKVRPKFPEDMWDHFKCILSKGEIMITSNGINEIVILNS